MVWMDATRSRIGKLIPTFTCCHIWRWGLWEAIIMVTYDVTGDIYRGERDLRQHACPLGPSVPYYETGRRPHKTWHLPSFFFINGPACNILYANRKWTPAPVDLDHVRSVWVVPNLWDGTCISRKGGDEIGEGLREKEWGREGERRVREGWSLVTWRMSMWHVQGRLKLHPWHRSKTCGTWTGQSPVSHLEHTCM